MCSLLAFSVNLQKTTAGLSSKPSSGVPNDKLFKVESFFAQTIPGHSQRHLQLIFNHRGKKTAALQSQLAMD